MEWQVHDLPFKVDIDSNSKNFNEQKLNNKLITSQTLFGCLTIMCILWLTERSLEHLLVTWSFTKDFWVEMQVLLTMTSPI